MSVLPPDSVLPRAQLKDGATAYIRELIISGQAAPGALLRLAPIAQRLDSSVTPIREALLLLAQDGWLTQEPNRGFRVARISRRDVEDAYFVHAFVAGELAARAAASVTSAALSEIRALDTEMQAQGDIDDGQLEEKNYALHNAVYVLADSPRLTWFVNASSRFVPRRFWGMIPGWFEHNRTGHAELIDALSAGDPERSRAAMSAHIRAAGNLLLSHLDSIAFWRDLEPS